MKMIEIVLLLLASNTLANAVSDRVDAPLLDRDNAPLVATLDLSNAKSVSKNMLSEAMETKMTDLVKMKLEEVLATLYLEEDVKRYIDNVKNNLTVNITDDIKRISDARILEKEPRRKDDRALSMCLGIKGSSYSHIKSVRRNCTSKTTCGSICKGVDNSLQCFNALHLYGRSESVAYSSAHVYGNGGCSATYCGPNYCCCFK
ncbi:unnamed protein product [Mytilus coruscus]|uniref:Uncharacterized protein n=1 Tax=Mytilus coruscus TaxID=42192 RepID=A0A6J8DTQ1_MYTCO|nr:unnamed protein product [Mytilus coruscus]